MNKEIITKAIELFWELDYLRRTKERIEEVSDDSSMLRVLPYASGGKLYDEFSSIVKLKAQEVKKELLGIIEERIIKKEKEIEDL